jgi:hypothetical protein
MERTEGGEREKREIRTTKRGWRPFSPSPESNKVQARIAEEQNTHAAALFIRTQPTGEEEESGANKGQMEKQRLLSLFSLLLSILPFSLSSIRLSFACPYLYVISFASASMSSNFL